MNRVLGIVLFTIALCVVSAAQNPGLPPVQSRQAAAPSQQWVDTYCRSLPAAKAFPTALTEVCQFALSSEQRFPDFICEQTTERYEPFRPSNSSVIMMRRSSVITSTVTYVSGQESYSNVRVDGKPTSADMLKVGGMSSEGEFATALRNLFEPESKTQFVFVRETTLESIPVLVFDFNVTSADSRWAIVAGTQPVTPAYHGRLWVSKTQAHVMRIEQQAEFERNFPYSGSTLAIDYADVQLGDRGSFTLPKRARMSACLRRVGEPCLRNEITFENCRKFTVKSRVLPMNE
jgi:hypothetical protein